MANWERHVDGSYWIQFYDERSQVARFLNNSSTGIVNARTVAEFDAQFKNDNTYTASSRIKDRFAVFGKICSVLLLVLAFLVGQAAVYYFYLTRGSVFPTNILLEDMQLPHIIIPSAIGLVSIVLIIIGTQILFEEGQSGDAWVYIIFSVLFFVGLPMLAGAIFLIPAIAIIPLIKSYNSEGIPIVISIIAFIIGQVVLWAIYLIKGYVVGLTELLEALNASEFNVFVILIMSGAINIAATILCSTLSYGFIYDDKKGLVYGILLVFCSLMVVTPVLSSVLSFLILFIIARCVEDSDQFQLVAASFIVFSMASMLFMFVPGVPLWTLLVMGAVEFGIFCIVFYGERTYCTAEEYSIPSIIVFSIIGIAFLGYIISHMDAVLPNLSTLIEMADKNIISKEYLSATTHDARIAMIVGTVVVALIMIIQVYMAKRRIPSVTSPLTTLSGITAFYLILNELIKIPESATAEYSPEFMLWTILGSILIALPTVIFQAITYSIGKKASEGML